MYKFITGILSILLLGSVQLAGQDVTFKASSKNVVRTGERFQLTYSINAEGQNFRGPDLKDFRVLSGPSTSQSSRIEIINGNVSQRVDYTFTYVIQAGEEGIFDIEPARITVDGKTIESNPIKIQVVKSSSQQQGAQQGGSQRGTPQGSQDDLSNDVFLKAVVDKTTPYQGEQVIITYKLYFRINISNLIFDKEPSFKGFWVDDLLENPQKFTQYQETYNGQLYQVAEVRKFALFPQQNGKVEIQPAKLTCQAQVQNKNSRSRDPFDSFFNDPFFNRFKTIEVPLSSNGITMNIKPLPASGKPADFSGAVGNFDFSSSIDRTSLKANEAINLKFTVSGTGNVELVDKINVKFPPDFEVYDPKISKNINDGQRGISGKKTFEYLLIPRTEGEFTIDPVNFVYFDLNKKQYVTLKTPEYNISVAKGDGSAANVTYSGVNRSDIQYIGSDIRHIKTTNPGLIVTGNYFFGSTLFYLLLLVPFALFILFTIIWKNELKKRSNMALMRNRKATSIARKRMKKAESFMKENNKDSFYVEVSQALWGYLSDKFSIPMANLSMDTVSETLQQKEVKEETIKQFMDTLNNCEFARFAPGESHGTMENIYNEAVNIITLMEKELK
ncbi:MAG: BatD family protein [Bacteroidetes bacterium]|nr:BatD family protein [Bacteroidota bacterium]